MFLKRKIAFLFPLVILGFTVQFLLERRDFHSLAQAQNRVKVNKLIDTAITCFDANGIPVAPCSIDDFYDEPNPRPGYLTLHYHGSLPSRVPRPNSNVTFTTGQAGYICSDPTPNFIYKLFPDGTFSLSCLQSQINENK
jgi:hypothetical protein